MINKYIVSAIVAAATVFAAYVFQFYIHLDRKISEDPSAWGPFGDYIGGLLNPSLSFISIVLLVRSLDIQKEENRNLKEELLNSERTERLRSFDTLFFNMINSQKELLSSLVLHFEDPTTVATKSGQNAIIELENRITQMRDESATDADIAELIDDIDETDQIYGIVRAFSVTVKMISEKLSDSKKFNAQERKERMLTLINFTDFAQLRLIVIGMQFMDKHSAQYLQQNGEFLEVLEDTGITLPLY